jgi:hypothetical protein
MPFSKVYDKKSFIFSKRDYKVAWTWKHTGMPRMEDKKFFCGAERPYDNKFIPLSLGMKGIVGHF